MNALRGLFRTTARLTAAAGLCVVAGGCVGDAFGEAKIDPSSKVAGEMVLLAKARTDYPSFKDIPAVSTDIRPIEMYGRAARDLEIARAQVEAATAPGTWTLSDSETFATSARQKAGPELPKAEPGVSEAFAKELRERATPPPRRK